MMRRTVWMLVLAMVSAACSPTTTTTEDSDTATTPTAPVATTTTMVAESTTTAATQSTTTTVASATTTVPDPGISREPFDGSLPAAFLLVDEAGLWLLSEDGSYELLATGEIHVAFDDRAGGVVFQGDPFVYPDEPPPILRLRPGNAEVEEIVTPGEQEIVDLEGVAIVDGSPTLLYLSRTWYSNPSTAGEVLVAFDLVTGAKQPVTTTGGWESGASRATFGGGVFAIEGSGEGFSWLDFVDLSGFPVDYPTNPIPDVAECFDTFECPTGVVISPDGLNLSFSRQQPDGASEVVIHFLGSGAESAYEVAQFPFWLDYDGSVIAAYLAPVWSDVFAETIVYELSDSGLEARGTLPGWASIVRSEVDIVGPVEVPAP